MRLSHTGRYLPERETVTMRMLNKWFSLSLPENFCCESTEQISGGFGFGCVLNISNISILSKYCDDCGSCCFNFVLKLTFPFVNSCC